MKKRFIALLVLCTLLTACANGGIPEDSSSESDSETVPATEAVTFAWEMDEAGVYEGEQEGMDFVINIPQGREIRVLQLTDTQLTDYTATRNQTRYDQIKGAFFSDGITDDDIKTYRYIREAVEKSNPDIIVITGDLIYGETDDSGEQFEALIDCMDGFKIPWALTFGNHDNESAKGVNWQIEKITESEYCVFKRGSVTGNSNYNIVLRQGGEIKYIMYMIDTNGCKEIANPGEGIMADNVDIKLITQKAGIYDDQISWFTETNSAIAAAAGKDTVPSLVFFHIEPYQFYEACEEIYEFNYSRRLKASEPGDFGEVNEYYKAGAVDRDGKFFEAAKAAGTTGMFFGHEHNNDASIVYDGIRLTFGSKTGTHSYSMRKLIGGTLITIAEGTSEMTVSHIKTELK